MAKKASQITYYEAVGRRREATAVVRLYISEDTNKTAASLLRNKKLNAGDIYVNGTFIETIFPAEIEKKQYLKPLELTDNMGRFAISIMTSGGGKKGQLDAIIHGLSRALVKVDEGMRPVLKEAGFLTRDPRAKERRKVGTGGKARRAKQSPKR